jgi:ankyrin repeat protein
VQSTGISGGNDVAIVNRIKLAVAMVAAALLLAAVPASAQHYSDGYKYLQAVEKSDLTTVKELVAKNSTVIDSRDISDGHSALHIVIKRRDASWLRYLLSLGTNPNMADKKGVTPMMLASQIGFVQGIEMLAQKGARIDDSNDAGETPLILAVHKRDIPMLRILLAAGADPDRSDNSGRTARDYARQDGPASSTLAEIDKYDKAKKSRKATQTYGPTF